jgi:Cof subfamily protein (haloacid dehalogenase superfamily)
LKLVAIDVDGTLLTSAHEITDATIDAVAAVRASGAEVVLASSRGARMMTDILRQLRLCKPAEFVAAQGALTASVTSDGRLRVIHEDAIPLGVAHELVALAEGAGFITHWFRGLDWFVPRIDDSVRREAAVVRSTAEVCDLFAVTAPPEKLMIVASPARMAALEVIAANLPRGLVAQTSGAGYLEITASGVDKGSAIKRMCAVRGIAAADVVAIGDGRNDLGLFRFAGVSIAMANAAEFVRERASWVTGNNDEDGVASALMALLER